jgi:hypothetical protein
MQSSTRYANVVRRPKSPSLTGTGFFAYRSPMYSYQTGRREGIPSLIGSSLIGYLTVQMDSCPHNQIAHEGCR